MILGKTLKNSVCIRYCNDVTMDFFLSGDGCISNFFFQSKSISDMKLKIGYEHNKTAI
jgi:hypothetical protein